VAWSAERLLGLSGGLLEAPLSRPAREFAVVEAEGPGRHSHGRRLGGHGVANGRGLVVLLQRGQPSTEAAFKAPSALAFDLAMLALARVEDQGRLSPQPACSLLLLTATLLPGTAGGQAADAASPPVGAADRPGRPANASLAAPDLNRRGGSADVSISLALGSEL